MKTINDVNYELIHDKQELYDVRKLDVNAVYTLRKKRADIKKVVGRIALKNQIILYLESNPSPGFVRKQMELVRLKIDEIKEITDDIRNKAPKSPKIKETEKLHGLKNLKQQYASLKYILNEQ